jgi:hypothetical protein
MTITTPVLKSVRGRIGDAGVTSLNQDLRRPVITIAKSGCRFKQTDCPRATAILIGRKTRLVGPNPLKSFGPADIRGHAEEFLDGKASGPAIARRRDRAGGQ